MYLSRFPKFPSLKFSKKGYLILIVKKLFTYKEYQKAVRLVFKYFQSYVNSFLDSRFFQFASFRCLLYIFALHFTQSFSFSSLSLPFSLFHLFLPYYLLFFRQILSKSFSSLRIPFKLCMLQTKEEKAPPRSFWRDSYICNYQQILC